MRDYIIKRVLLCIPTLLFVTIIVFLSVRFIPGNVVDLMVAEMAAESGMHTELTVEYIRHTLGLDVPVHIQYGHWLAGIFRGDLGVSIWTNRPVTAEIIGRLPVSLELGLMGFMFALLLALPIGVYSAIRQDTWGDYAGRTIAILAISLPTFWIGTLVIVYPSIWWHWAPAMEYIPFYTDPVGNLVQFVIPAIIVGGYFSGLHMRMTRTTMLEVLRQDYVRTAWSKGLTERVVIVRHALKNALLPVITIAGFAIAHLIAGQVVIEQIFALPGLGRFLLEGITKRDYPIISGINLFLATFVLIMNVLVDLAYAWLDPRVQYK